MTMIGSVVIMIVDCVIICKVAGELIDNIRIWEYRSIPSEIQSEM